MPKVDRPLRVFLCHASQDKPMVRELYNRLAAEGWIDPWLDEEKISLGQHWTTVIEDALDASDLVIIFLSRNSVQKEGFVQRELNYAWDLSLEKPRNVIFLIPFRLDDCEVPRYLRSRQWGDYFGGKKETTYQNLLRSLKQRYQQKLLLEAKEREHAQNLTLSTPAEPVDEVPDFLRAAGWSQAVNASDKSKSASTNGDQAAAEQPDEIPDFLRAAGRAQDISASDESKSASTDGDQVAVEQPIEYIELPDWVKALAPSQPVDEGELPDWINKIGVNAVPISTESGNQPDGMQQFRQTAEPLTPVKTTSDGHPIYTFGDIECVKIPPGKFLMGSSDIDKQADADEKPQHSIDLPYGYYMARFPVTNEQYAVYTMEKRIKHPVRDWEEKTNHPAMNISWDEAMIYCRWLNEVLANELPSGFVLRLPTEAEWEKAARGEKGIIYPWGNTFDKNKCNTYEGGNRGTTPVGKFSPHGDSPYGCADMSGNVWEWTHSLYKLYPYRANDGREVETTKGKRILRGGSFYDRGRFARCASRFNYLGRGFRMAIAPPLPQTFSL